MLRRLLICLFIGLTIGPAVGQNTTLVLSKTKRISKGSEPVDVLNLATQTGWIYKPGHNPAWARPDLNTTDWTKRTPASFSAQDADSTGRAEGWFRLRLRIDSTFDLLPLELVSDAWAASEVYVNGKRVATFGSTGTSHKPYAENNPHHKQGLPVPFEAGKVYVIAVHLVDYVFPFPPLAPEKLKSDVFQHVDRVLILGRPQQLTDRFMRSSTLQAIFYTLWSTVSILLALAFWVLSSQKLPEKDTIRLWAIVETLFAITNLCRYTDLLNTSFAVDYFVRNQFIDLLLWQALSLDLVALLRIFNYPVDKKWIGIGMTLSLMGGLAGMYTGLGSEFFYGGCVCQQLILTYVLIVSWKRLKGAQWAIVAGGGLSALFGSLLAVNSFVAHIPFASPTLTTYLLFSGGLLFLPLSFLVYLMLRFKEVLALERANAAAVVLVTQEKQALLANQNERLEQQVQQRTAELEASLEELRRTQDQLIQAEKMATMGKLTKGIVDRILNPLNYIKNFSLNAQELVQEIQLVTEKQQALLPADQQNELSDGMMMLAQNLTKINEHSNNTTRILQDMQRLLKERSSTLILTDLNPFLTQHIDTALQKAITKYPSLSVQLDLQLSPQAIPVHLLPVEFSEVLFSLVDNTCYTLAEKSRREKAFKARLEVRTQVIDDQAQLQVRDNGRGIPTHEASQLFNPFFTTKPVAKGTGLGLFMSKDLVEYLHGHMQIESVVDQYTQVTIQLPLIADRTRVN